MEIRAIIKGTPKVGAQENITWNPEETPQGHVTHSKSALIHYTTLHDTHLACHPVPHQYFIHARYFGNKMPHTTKKCITYVSKQTHKGGR